MANNNNWQQIQISGDGNAVGNNNVLKSRKEEHHHHHCGSSSKGGNGGDDAMGIGFGILAAVLVICWLFVRHAEEIYFYIKLSAFISAIPLLGVVLIALFWKAPDNRQTTATVFGFALSIVAFFLAQYGQDCLDPRLLQFSQQARNAWDFWNGLTEHGHHVVMGGLTGAICLGAATLFSLLMGIFVLWHFLVDTDVEENFLLRILNPFRPARCGIFATLLLLTAWAFESGYIFEILKSATQH